MAFKTYTFQIKQVLQQFSKISYRYIFPHSQSKYKLNTILCYTEE